LFELIADNLHHALLEPSVRPPTQAKRKGEVHGGLRHLGTGVASAFAHDIQQRDTLGSWGLKDRDGEPEDVLKESNDEQMSIMEISLDTPDELKKEIAEVHDMVASQ
jgi:hypothetical protein